jgi:hypothetical protein
MMDGVGVQVFYKQKKITCGSINIQFFNISRPEIHRRVGPYAKRSHKKHLECASISLFFSIRDRNPKSDSALS